MFTGVRAICSCGSTFPLPQEAFSSGTSCPGCGADHSAEEMMALRPPAVTRTTGLALLWALTLLVLVKALLLVVQSLQNAPALHALRAQLGDYAPVLIRCVSTTWFLPSCGIAIVVAAVVALVRGLRRKRGRADLALGVPVFLCALLATTILLGSLYTFSIRTNLIHL